jgi:hypothetical protein
MPALLYAQRDTIPGALSNTKEDSLGRIGLFNDFTTISDLVSMNKAELLPRQGGGKYGLIDRQGKVILDNEYDEILGFSHGRARVNKGGTVQYYGRVEGGQWGYINKQGEEVIPLQYDKAWYFTEGLAAVQKDGQWMFIDTLGNVQLDLGDQYNQVWHFQDGLAKVMVYDEDNGSRKYSMIDREGKEILPWRGHWEYPQNGLLFYQRFNERSYATPVSKVYDLKGNLFALPQEKKLLRLHPEYAVVEDPNDPLRERVVDLNGNPLIPYGVQKVLSYGEGKAIVQDVSIRELDAKTIATVIDTSGSVSPIVFTENRFNYPDSFLVSFQLTPMTSGPDGTAEQYAVPVSSAYPFRDQFAVIAVNHDPGIPIDFRGPDGRTLKPFNNKGLIDQSGEIILFPIYYKIDVKNSLIAASQWFLSENDQYWEYQLLDQYGNPVFIHAFNQLQLIDGDRAIAQTDDGWGMVNAAGDTLIPFIYQELKPPKDGLVLAKKDLKYGYLDTLGNIVVPFQFELARPYEEEVAIFGEGGLWGFVDNNDQWVIRDQFYEVRPFSEGFAAVMDHNQKWAFINRQGARRTLSQFTATTDFSDGVAWGTTRGYGYWGLYGQQDGRIIQLYPHELLEFRDFSKGVAAVRKGNLWGYLRADGRLLTPIQYFRIDPFEDGFARVETASGQGMIDTTGREIVPPVFSRVSGLADNGFIPVYQSSGNVKGLYSPEGKELLPPIYQTITPFQKGIAIVSTNEFQMYKTQAGGEISVIPQGNTGIIDLNCQWIIPPVLNVLTEFQLGVALFNQLDSVSYRQKWGIIDDRGLILQEAFFDGISLPSDFGVSTTMLLKDGTEYFGLINRRGKELAACEFLSIDFRNGHYFARDQEGSTAIFNQFGELLHQVNCEVEDVLDERQALQYLLLKYPEKQQLLSIDGAYSSPAFDVILQPKNGFFRFMDKGVYGFYDMKKDEILASGFEDAYNFENGYAAVRQNGRWGWIDEKGRIRLKCQFLGANDYSGAFVGKTKEGWHVLNKRGKVKTQKAYGFISNFEEDLQLARVIRNGKIGFVNTKGKEIFPPVLNFYDYNDKGDLRHLIRVQKEDSGMGLINTLGEIVLPLEYEMVERFSQYGLIRVQKGDYHGLIDFEGNTILPPVYEFVRFIGKEMVVGVLEEPGDYGPNRWTPGKYRLFYLENGQANAIPESFIYYMEISPEWNLNPDYLVVKNRKGKEYLIDRTGRKVSGEYDRFYFDDPDPGFIRATLEADTLLQGRDTTLTFYALIDPEGRETLRSPHIIGSKSYTEPLYHPVIPRGNSIYTGIYYPNENIYIPPNRFTNILEPSEGTSLIGVRDINKNQTKWGFFDWRTGEMRLDFNYAEAFPFKNGHTLVKKSPFGGTGFVSIDTLGNETLPEANIRFIDEALNDNYFICRGSPQVETNRNYNEGIIHRDGSLMFPLKYSFIADYKNGYAAVVNGGSQERPIIGGVWGIVDSTGREVIPLSLQLDGLRLFSGDVAPVRKLGRWGLMNKQTRLIVDFQYDDIQDFSNGYALVKKDRKFGFINERGQTLDSIRYLDARSFSNGFAAVQLEAGWSLLDSAGMLNTNRFDQISDVYLSKAIGNFGGSMTENDWCFQFTGGSYDLLFLDITEKVSASGPLYASGDLLLLKGTVPVAPFSGRPLYELTSLFIEDRSKAGGTYRISSNRFNWPRQERGRAFRFIARMQQSNFEVSPFFVLDRDPAETKEEQYYLFFIQDNSGSPFDKRPGFAIPLDDYDQVLPFSAEASIVRKNNRYGLISNTNGSELLEVEYTSIEPLTDEGKARVRFPDFYGSFYIDAQGRCVEECDRLQTYQNR